MADQVSDEFKADLNIRPINSYTIKQSTKVMNNNSTEKKETKSIEETKKSNPEDEVNKDINNWFHEMIVEEAVEGILDPSDVSEREPVKVEEPPEREIKIIKKVNPVKVEEKKTTPKSNNNKKTQHAETPDEMEKRLLHELLLEMNEGEVVGILDLSSTPQGSRTASKASGKK